MININFFRLLFICLILLSFSNLYSCTSANNGPDVRTISLVGSIPADNEEDVDFNLSKIVLEFSRSVYLSSHSDSLNIQPYAKVGDISFMGSRAIIDIDDLNCDTKYVLSIPSGFFIDQDNNLNKEFSITFKTAVNNNDNNSDWDVEPDMNGVESNSFSLIKNINVGWNLGNALESYYEGYPDDINTEISWGNPKVTPEMIHKVREAGFNAVRVPVRWYPHVVDVNDMNIIDKKWLDRVKEVVDYCIDNNMYVILNTHHEDWMESFPLFINKEEILRKERNLWRAIATFFRDYDEHLIFAGTNEVEINWQKPTSENLEVQNSFNQCFVDAVRSTGGKNYYRNLIVQMYATNPDYAFDGQFLIPRDVNDGRLIVEFHYYRPSGFAYMDCKNHTYTDFFYFWGSDFNCFNHDAVSFIEDEEYIDNYFSKIRSEWIDKGIPVVMGEYGIVTTLNDGIGNIDKQIASKEYYMKYVTSTARKYGIVPFVWDNGSFYTKPDKDGKEHFGLFDRKNDMQQNNVSSAIINGIMEGTNVSYPY